MYVTPNFKTKKAFKEAVAQGKACYVFQPNEMSPTNVKNIRCCVEGPHYPEPHRWYATVTTDADGKALTVK